MKHKPFFIIKESAMLLSSLFFITFANNNPNINTNEY